MKRTEKHKRNKQNVSQNDSTHEKKARNSKFHKRIKTPRATHNELKNIEALL